MKECAELISGLHDKRIVFSEIFRTAPDYQKLTVDYESEPNVLRYFEPFWRGWMPLVLTASVRNVVPPLCVELWTSRRVH